MRPILLKWMKLFGILFGTSSLVACSMLGVERPDSYVCGVNVVADPAYLLCFNLKKDYDDDGNLKPDAQPLKIILKDLTGLKGFTCTDAVGLKNIKTFVADMRDEINKRCQN